MVRKGVGGGGRRLGWRKSNGGDRLHESQTLEDEEKKILRKMYRISGVLDLSFKKAQNCLTWPPT